MAFTNAQKQQRYRARRQFWKEELIKELEEADIGEYNLWLQNIIRKIENL